MTAAAALAAIILAVAPTPVEHAPCPGTVAYASCYIPAPVDKIYIDPVFPPETQDQLLWHERGHAADFHFLTAAKRRGFTCLHAVRTTEDRSRCGNPWGPTMKEIWAGAYASCHFRLLPSRGALIGDEYEPKSDKRQVSACRFIARAVTADQGT